MRFTLSLDHLAATLVSKTLLLKAFDDDVVRYTKKRDEVAAEIKAIEAEIAALKEHA